MRNKLSILSKHLAILSLLMIATIVGTTFMTSDTLAQADPNEILDPEPFVLTYVNSPEPHYVGVMEYGEATFIINGDTLTTRAYRQEGGTYAIPGPTMNMVPGNKYVLRFRNLLPYEAPSPVHNDLKDPNITNLHTHGLHISGESPGDDVTRMFEGGFGGDYVYDIPADHMGGTFWYHARHHGSTFSQVSTGGFDFIMIDDRGDGIPANVAAMEVSSPAIHLSWTDNSNDETSFNIEHNGIGFYPIASVGANVVSYTDTGLSPNTAYQYRVNAENSGGASVWSNVAEVTTLADTEPTAVDVGSVVLTTFNTGQGYNHDRRPVLLADDLGGLVEGATVIGDFTGSFNERGSGTTDASGKTVIDTFTVTVKSPETGCDRYADWWEVISTDGRLIHRRVLLHSHVGEQPFVRSGGPVPISVNERVIVRAHMSSSGYSGLAFQGTVAGGFQSIVTDQDFYPALASQRPLPSGCGF